MQRLSGLDFTAIHVQAHFLYDTLKYSLVFNETSRIVGYLNKNALKFYAFNYDGTYYDERNYTENHLNEPCTLGPILFRLLENAKITKPTYRRGYIYTSYTRSVRDGLVPGHTRIDSGGKLILFCNFNTL